MKKDDHYLLGSLLKTIGIKGEVILRFNNDCSEEIQKLESIFIDVDNKLVPFFIEELKFKSAITATVKLEGLNNELKSSEFIGLDFYISHERAKELQLVSEDHIDVKGYKVFDQNNEFVGTVLEFIDIPENPLLNVNTSESEILIPAKDELIIEVDDDIEEIRLNISDGLLETD